MDNSKKEISLTLNNQEIAYTADTFYWHKDGLPFMSLPLFFDGIQISVTGIQPVEPDGTGVEINITCGGKLDPDQVTVGMEGHEVQIAVKNLPRGKD